jgi:hypothetical protein
MRVDVSVVDDHAKELLPAIAAGLRLPLVFSKVGPMYPSGHLEAEYQRYASYGSMQASTVGQMVILPWLIARIVYQNVQENEPFSAPTIIWWAVTLLVLVGAISHGLLVRQRRDGDGRASENLMAVRRRVRRHHALESFIALPIGVMFIVATTLPGEHCVAINNAHCTRRMPMIVIVWLTFIFGTFTRPTIALYVTIPSVLADIITTRSLPNNFSVADTCLRAAFYAIIVVPLYCDSLRRDTAMRDSFIDQLRIVQIERRVDQECEAIERLATAAVPKSLLESLLTFRIANPTTRTPFSHACACGTVGVSCLPNFSRWSAAHMPNVALELLHTLFTVYDAAAVCFGVDRVAFYGDQYVFSAGLIRKSNRHAGRVAAFALWQRAVMRSPLISKMVKSTVPGAPELFFSSSIATGPLTGCIVASGGQVRYLYGGSALRDALVVMNDQIPDTVLATYDTAMMLQARPFDVVVVREQPIKLPLGNLLVYRLRHDSEVSSSSPTSASHTTSHPFQEPALSAPAAVRTSRTPKDGRSQALRWDTVAEGGELRPLVDVMSADVMNPFLGPSQVDLMSSSNTFGGRQAATAEKEHGSRTSSLPAAYRTKEWRHGRAHEMIAMAVMRTTRAGAAGGGDRDDMASAGTSHHPHAAPHLREPRGFLEENDADDDGLRNTPGCVAIFASAPKALENPLEAEAFRDAANVEVSRDFLGIILVIMGLSAELVILRFTELAVDESYRGEGGGEPWADDYAAMYLLGAAFAVALVSGMAFYFFVRSEPSLAADVDEGTQEKLPTFKDVPRGRQRVLLGFLSVTAMIAIILVGAAMIVIPRGIIAHSAFMPPLVLLLPAAGLVRTLSQVPAVVLVALSTIFLSLLSNFLRTNLLSAGNWFTVGTLLLFATGLTIALVHKVALDYYRILTSRTARLRVERLEHITAITAALVDQLTPPHTAGDGIYRLAATNTEDESLASLSPLEQLSAKLSQPPPLGRVDEFEALWLRLRFHPYARGWHAIPAHMDDHRQRVAYADEDNGNGNDRAFSDRSDVLRTPNSSASPDPWVQARHVPRATTRGTEANFGPPPTPPMSPKTQPLRRPSNASSRLSHVRNVVRTSVSQRDSAHFLPSVIDESTAGGMPRADGWVNDSAAVATVCSVVCAAIEQCARDMDVDMRLVAFLGDTLCVAGPMEIASLYRDRDRLAELREQYKNEIEDGNDPSDRDMALLALEIERWRAKIAQDDDNMTALLRRGVEAAILLTQRLERITAPVTFTAVLDHAQVVGANVGRNTLRYAALGRAFHRGEAIGISAPTCPRCSLVFVTQAVLDVTGWMDTLQPWGDDRPLLGQGMRWYVASQGAVKVYPLLDATDQHSFLPTARCRRASGN